MNHNQSLKFIENIKPYMIIPYKIEQIKKCELKCKEKWDRKFKCSFCDKELSDLPGKLRHEKTFHINPVKIKCDYCNNTFMNKTSVNRHVKISHNFTYKNGELLNLVTNIETT